MSMEALGMSGTLRIIGLAAMGLLLSGCVTQEKYNALKLDRDRYAEQLATAQSEASSANARADALQRQIDAIANSGNSKDAMILNLTKENGDLQARLAELNAKYQEALNRPVGVAALPEALSNELSQFARQNPDLVEFDASRGIVKFKSDVTFATGDAELTAKAREVIARFATILNSSAAAQYELLVAGHTDNQPVRNPQTLAKGHKDNWYLSAHRAISVASALIGDRVSPSRLGVVGYADQHPVASNGSESGRAQNRRVEVLILPTTVRGQSVAGNNTPAAPKPANKMNKDGTVDSRPAMNK
jgi:chemotaxis protein MotB